MGGGWRIVMGVLLGCWLWLAALPIAGAADLAQTPLTITALQARIDQPVRRDGKLTIDLRDVVLDLRAENGEFGDRFYRLLQTTLQRGDTVFNLDLSHAVVKGEFDLQRLSLREPLYGDAFFPLLSDREQSQLKRDRRRLFQLRQLSRSLLLQSQTTAARIYLFRGGLTMAQTHFEGPVIASDIFFLEAVAAQGAQFEQSVDFSDSRFSQSVTLVASQFQQAARWRGCRFFNRLRLGQALFQGLVTFQGSEFSQSAGFEQTRFQQGANFSRTTFQKNVDFGQTRWQANGSFLNSVFGGDVFLTEARFEAPISFRQSRLSQAMNLRGAMIERQLDFGDMTFGPQTRINVAGLNFDTEQGGLLGSPGQIGRVLSVPSLEGNETLLRNLVRNFRRLEQVADANRIEYMTERLRLRSLQRQLTGTNLNTASRSRLQAVGFSPEQSQTILDQRQQLSFVNPSDILDLPGFNLSTYIKVRDRVIARSAVSLSKRLQLGLRWLALSALLLLSHYGTSIGLTLGVGILAIALSSLLFWWVDRYRRQLPTPIIPSRPETLWMLGSFGGLLSLGLLVLWRLADTPGFATLAIILLVLPVPSGLMAVLYRQGRVHGQRDTRYLVEDGSARQLRLLIARLPVIPKFPFYRDRFYPIDWQKRRNWLNYYDFSLNNWFKFGFNDLRLRDADVPGLVTALVWYQWAIGLAYVTLLLWTFSRTIPGLNLLLYF
ncbi:MAG: pentapeptide repeat-containing protein [Cyanobacteria bacterium P01_A01_bin.70]